MTDLHARLDLSASALIEASAGTGKTYTLERLVLRALTEGAQPIKIDQILVLTFTEKAAEEMRERIRSLIVESMSSEGKGSSLQMTLELFSQAHIETIHRFCQRVLSDHALKTGWEINHDIQEEDELVEMSVRDVLRSEFGEEQQTNGPLSIVSIGLGLKSFEELVVLLTSMMMKNVHGENNVLVPDKALSFKAMERIDAIGQEWISSFYEKIKKTFSSINEEHVRGDHEKRLNKARAKFEKYIKAKTEISHWLDGLSLEHTEFFYFVKYFKSSFQELTKPLDEKKRLKGVDVSDLSGEKGYLACQELEQEIQYWYTQIELASTALFHPLLNKISEQIKYLKGQRKEKGFDDLLSACLRALKEVPAFKQSLRGQFKLIFIDEFQDTDIQQWEIFRTLAYEKEKPILPLILIGDPKQSIYRFRGADLNVYFKAKEFIGRTFSLTTNYRSSPAYVKNVNAFFSEVFSEKGVAYTEVGVPDQAEFTQVYLKGKVVNAFYFWDLAQSEGSKEHAFWTNKEDLRWLKVLGLQIQRYLKKGEIFTQGKQRNLEASDIAILAENNKDAEKLSNHLMALNIPVVMARGLSIWKTKEARELLLFLYVLESPKDRKKIRALLLSSIFQYSLEQILTESLHVPWLEKIMDWKSLVENKSCMAWVRDWLATELKNEETFATYLLSQVGGERKLANIEHLGELLQEAQLSKGLTLSGMIQFLKKKIGKGESEEVTRLEKDLSAVQIITMHKSKGLEYPVVFLYPGGQSNRSAAFVEYDQGGKRVIDMQPTPATKKQSDELAFAEKKRVYYVAMTRGRACLHAPIYAESRQSKTLNRIIQDMFPGSKKSSPVFWEWVAAQDEMKKMLIEDVDLDAYHYSLPLQIERKEKIKLIPPKFGFISRMNRHVETVQSFSRLAEQLCHVTKKNQMSEMVEKEGQVDDVDALLSPEKETMLDFSGGAAFGNLFHELLEQVDWEKVAAAKLPEDLKKEKMTMDLFEQLARKYFDLSWLTHYSSWVMTLVWNVFHAQVHPGFCLGNVLNHEKKVELGFHLPLKRNRFSMRLTELDHELEVEVVQGGMMMGYIDLIYKHERKVYVADWKTNVLGSAPEDYHREACRAAMLKHAYHLQAMIYTAATCLFLKKNNPAFDYEKDFGGVGYFFIRGMSPGVEGQGVYAFRPTEEELSTFIWELTGEVWG